MVVDLNYRDIQLLGKLKESKEKSTAMVRNFDKELFDELKVLRLRIAKEKNLPAYCIFWNSTLEEMAGMKPVSEEAFLQIKGVSTNKMHEYGKAFIDLINSHVNITKIQIEENNTAEHMFCKYCGAKIDSDSAFCKRCGRKLIS